MNPSLNCSVITGIQASVECKVCNDSFSVQGLKVPRLLTCGHTLCHACLCHLFQTGHGLIICPFDRQATAITGENGVWGLKKNFTLIEFLEKFLQQQNSPSRSSTVSSNAATAIVQISNDIPADVTKNYVKDEVALRRHV